MFDNRCFSEKFLHTAQSNGITV